MIKRNVFFVVVYYDVSGGVANGSDRLRKGKLMGR